MNTTTPTESQHLDGPTAKQFAAYRSMFGHFNQRLFNGELPEPLLNLSRGPQRALAFFAPNRWTNKAAGAEKTTHEISLNPRYLADGSARETAQNLVHEMVHLWQQVHGTPPRKGYHDRQWSTKMVAVGLQPINAKTGKPAMSAHSMSDTVIDGGPFMQAFASLPEEALLPWSCVEARRGGRLQQPAQPGESQPDDEAEEQQPKRNKVKYTCASCGANVWGKPELLMACLNTKHDPAPFMPVQ